MIRLLAQSCRQDDGVPKMKKFYLIFTIYLLFCIPAFAQKAEKLDEFSNLSCDEYLMRMDNALVRAHENPSATVYVYIYDGKENIYNPRKMKMEMVLPARGSAKAKIASMKKYLLTKKILIKNIKFVEAGFREDSTVEFWLVPNGAEPPKPAPTLEKMKYRKGKPTGFCTDCC